MSAKRLNKELQQLGKLNLDWVTIAPHNDELLHWRASMMGPAESHYAGGIFLIDFIFDAQYPFKAPTISFVTKIYHPNVKSDTGDICADLISNGWGPTLNVKHCLEVLRSMLITPNPDSPVEETIAGQLRDDPAEFEKNAKKWVEDYASGS
mmetsp:Transcript_23024/g.43278  ORF Transcript_23024/g.43278 Transcript_23024/m.43278 type:complete len:151 (-) Transcript_23024:171-623(-)